MFAEESNCGGMVSHLFMFSPAPLHCCHSYKYIWKLIKFYRALMWSCASLRATSSCTAADYEQLYSCYSCTSTNCRAGKPLRTATIPCISSLSCYSILVLCLSVRLQYLVYPREVVSSDMSIRYGTNRSSKAY